MKDSTVVEAFRAHALLHEMAHVYAKMSKESQAAVYKRVVESGALPLGRDTPSYIAVMSVLHGGASEAQLEYMGGVDDVDSNIEHGDEVNLCLTTCTSVNENAFISLL